MALPTQSTATTVPATAAAQRSRRTDSQPELEDTYLVALAKSGSADAYERMIKRYRGFVRLKASSYFLLGGDSEDLIQEGLVGLYKAIRDFRTDRESSFRNFAELCITRQIITAVKTASRNKHAPLNQYVSFAQIAGGGRRGRDDARGHPSRADLRRARRAGDRKRGAVRRWSRAFRACSRSSRAGVLSLYLDGHSYEQIGERLECDTKTVDNALQRVKRKVASHVGGRAVLV